MQGGQLDLGIRHHNYNVRNRTLLWSGTDSQANFLENCKHSGKLETLRKLGWLDTECITYNYNSHGFRDIEFDERECGLALGCSYTEGVGIPQETVWPRILGQLTNIYVWNLGVGGSSLDTCFRLLDHWLPAFNPKFIVLCLPPGGRTEVFDYFNPASLLPNHHHVKHLNDYYKVWSTSDANLLISKRKNLLAIQQLCNQRQIPLCYLDHSLMLKQPYARDLMHCGVNSHANFAEQIYNLLPKEIL